MPSAGFGVGGPFGATAQGAVQAIFGDELNNRQIGLTCDAAVQARGLLSRGNAGGVEVGSACNVTPCPAESATCGSSVTPPP